MSNMTLGSFVENYLKTSTAILLYKLRILPKMYRPKVKAMIASKAYFKKFTKLDLIYKDKGYFIVDPMPSKEELNQFYEEVNFAKGIEKNHPVKLRDIQHYNLLLNTFPNLNDSQKNIVNFGAGPGGISILLNAAGHNIINVEPSKIAQYFKNNWTTVNSTDEIKISIDLFYASHSLEHVTDIDVVIKDFKKLSNENTIYFFEVPNHNPGIKHKIDPPHTYYFSSKFFESNFNEVIHSRTYLKNGKLMKGDSGDCLRFIAK
jgi:predicted SAM-dependent methyltransferase